MRGWVKLGDRCMESRIPILGLESLGWIYQVWGRNTCSSFPDDPKMNHLFLEVCEHYRSSTYICANFVHRLVVWRGGCIRYRMSHDERGLRSQGCCLG